ncbi:MAG: flippase-like domain-containing protein [Acidimicrobiia bacterium]|nr:flippase-like domain-containing protein [Acidimicrobiia bacterium]
MSEEQRWATGDRPGSLETGELPPLERDPTRPARRPRRFKPVGTTLKTLAFLAALWFFLLPLIPGFRKALSEIRNVQPGLLVLGLLLQVAALFCYSLLTRASLGEAGRTISRMRMFRIQMSTKALSNIIPAGNAASSALGYRLLTLSGISGPDAGFALGTAGLGSAVVLNALLWIALIVSIPIRGVSELYVIAALAGVFIMLLAGALVVGLVHGQGQAERILRWLGDKLHFDGAEAAGTLRQVGARLQELIEDRALMKRVAAWAAANWLLDAASLWVFVRAFGPSLALDVLIVTFGLANVIAVIPITPGGLGIVEFVYIPTLAGLGNLRRSVTTLSVASYRLAQFWFPILLGGILYASLRVGPWSITRRERLARLRDLAEQERGEGRESRIEFASRNWDRVKPTPPL